MSLNYAEMSWIATKLRSAEKKLDKMKTKDSHDPNILSYELAGIRNQIEEEIGEPTSEEELIEQLADLEHRQWMHWSKYVAENHDIPEELREKWEKNWKPYEDLSEEMKDKDRKWAKKALAVIRETNGDSDAVE